MLNAQRHASYASSPDAAVATDSPCYPKFVHSLGFPTNSPCRWPSTTCCGARTLAGRRPRAWEHERPPDAKLLCVPAMLALSRFLDPSSLPGKPVWSKNHGRRRPVRVQNGALYVGNNSKHLVQPASTSSYNCRIHIAFHLGIVECRWTRRILDPCPSG